jgi:predicted alpha/beta superfamily hydrolase
MIRVLIEIGNSSRARSKLLVRAESIRQAVSVVEFLYPGLEARVVFPIEPETFFIKDMAALEEFARVEMPQSLAG